MATFIIGPAGIVTLCDSVSIENVSIVPLIVNESCSDLTFVVDFLVKDTAYFTESTFNQLVRSTAYLSTSTYT